jgi:flagellar basal body-associated protein FliL
MDNQNNSGVNTILIVIVLMILVGAMVWFFTSSSAPEQESGLQVDVNLPAGSNEVEAE